MDDRLEIDLTPNEGLTIDRFGAGWRIGFWDADCEAKSFTDDGALKALRDWLVANVKD